MPTDEKVLKENESAVAELMNELGLPDAPAESEAFYCWRSQPRQLIINLLQRYRVHPQDLGFRPQDIAAYLKSSDVAALNDWDIYVRRGGGKTDSRFGFPIALSARKLTKSEEPTMFSIGEYKSRRLTSGGDEYIGLTSAQREELSALVAELSEKGKKKFREVDFINVVRKRPTLVLYFVDAKKDDYIPEVSPFTAISLNFLEFKDDDMPEQEIFFANQVWQRTQEFLRADLDEDDAVMNQGS